jgi:hypothetical protein
MLTYVDSDYEIKKKQYLVSQEDPDFEKSWRNKKWFGKREVHFERTAG